MFPKDSKCSPWPIIPFHNKMQKKKKTMERGRDLERLKKVKGVEYVVMNGDQTLGDEHTVQYTDNILSNCTLEACH